MKQLINSLYFKIIVSLVAIYTLFGFILVPFLIQTNFTKLVKKHLNTYGYVQKIYINPYSFEITVKNLLINDDKNEALLYFKNLNLKLEPTALFNNKIQLKYLHMDSLKSSISIYKNNQFNFSHILKKLSKDSIKNKESKNNNLIFNIKDLHLKNTKLYFKDYTKNEPFKIDTKPFDLNLKNFSTKANKKAILKTNIDIPNTLKLTLNSNIFINPTLNINGDIKLEELNLSKIDKYLKNDINFNFDGTIKEIFSNFKITQNKNFNLDLNNFFILLNNFTFFNKQFKLELKNLSNKINNIKIQKNTKFDYDIKDIIVKNKTIKITDLKKDKNKHFVFENLNLQIDKYSNKKNTISDINFSINTPKRGNIKLLSKVSLSPLSLDNKVQVDNLTLVPYKEYIKSFINIDIKSANVDIKSNSTIKKDSKNIDANLIISNINLFNSIKNNHILDIKKLNIKDLNYQNNHLTINNIILDELNTSFKIDQNKNTNFSDIFIKKQAKKTQKTPSTKFDYYIKNLIIKKGRTSFLDHSLPLKFDTYIHNLNGKISNISSKNLQSKLQLKGTIKKYALADIKGDIFLSDLKSKADIKINFENLDIKSLSPYSGKFIGQKMQKGRLWLDLKYNIENSKLLSTNNIKIKNIELGEKIDEQKAKKLPIELAIALLEDSKGYIDIDIPIKGDMSKPEFKLDKVIYKAFRNIITNIANAPFKFLGSLLNLKSNELDTIQFNYADYQISPPQKEKLDNLIKVLKNKKNLMVILQASFDSLNDTKALKQNRFNKMIQSEDINKAIIDLYEEKFGIDQLNKIKKANEKQDLSNILSKEIKKTIVISIDELNSLAQKRVFSLKNYFIKEGLDIKRIKIKKDTIDIKTNNKKFSLKLKLDTNN